jgi:hypothetical protein
LVFLSASIMETREPIWLSILSWSSFLLAIIHSCWLTSVLSSVASP